MLSSMMRRRVIYGRNCVIYGREPVIYGGRMRAGALKAKIVAGGRFRRGEHGGEWRVVCGEWRDVSPCWHRNHDRLPRVYL